MPDMKKPKKQDRDKPIYINEYERNLGEEENTSDYGKSNFSLFVLQ
jgi:hypothetical protein